MVDLAIDIGQTQARVRVLRKDTKCVQDLEVPGFTYGADLSDTIMRIVEQSVQGLNLDTLDAVAVGSTGLYGQVPLVDDIFQRLSASFATRYVVVADDAVAAYLGAIGNQDGVVVAAGTGIVGLAHGPDGVARVDGVGGMIGDEGSGWWIGRQGLIAAISARDGRWKASPALLQRLEERFGPVGQFPAMVAASQSPVAVVASFAKEVADIAREGDPVAADIWHQAGDFIGGVIAAAASRAGLNGRSQWALVGRISEAGDLLQPGLDRRLSQLALHAERVEPVGGVLDGVALLLTVDPRSYAPMAQARGIR